MTDQASFIQTVIEYLEIPVLAVVSILGWEWKRITTRVNVLETEVSELKIHKAKTEAEMEAIIERLDYMTEKLDKLLDHLLK